MNLVCVGTPLPLHNKYIYKTTKDSLKLMIMGVLGGRIFLGVILYISLILGMRHQEIWPPT